MRIGIDARAAMNTTDGIGRYAVELLKAFSQRDDSNQYVIIKNSKIDFSFEYDKRFSEIMFPAKRYGPGEQFLLPKLLIKNNLDIFHSLHFTLPLNYSGKMVMTVHDIMPVLFPWFFGTNGIVNHISSKYLTWLVKHSLQRSTLVIVDSNYTALDICKYFKIAAHRMHRVYLGNDHLKSITSDKNENIRTKYNLSQPFLLTITNFRPYKNTSRLLEAFKIVRGILPELVLVVIGSNPKYFKRTLGQFSESDIENVRFLGYVDDKSLIGLLNSAEAFVFPSLYEGFGFPILESMAVRTPVVTSTSASLPELGGDAVVYVDPLDVNNIADGIISVCTDKDLRNDLREKGIKQSNLFRWYDTAEETLGLYKKAINL